MSSSTVPVYSASGTNIGVVHEGKLISCDDELTVPLYIIQPKPITFSLTLVPGQTSGDIIHVNMTCKTLDGSSWAAHITIEVDRIEDELNLNLKYKLLQINVGFEQEKLYFNVDKAHEHIVSAVNRIIHH